MPQRCPANATRPSITLSLLALILACAGCGEANLLSISTPPTWEMVLKISGQEVTLPMTLLEVYVTDDYDYPEIYELSGEGITLVGEFPLDIRVDYGETWPALFGQQINILPRYNTYDGPKESYITLPSGQIAEVTGGHFTAESQSGQYAGRDGDLTLSGKITLHLKTGSGEEKIARGTFAVHCMTWG